MSTNDENQAVKRQENGTLSSLVQRLSARVLRVLPRNLLWRPQPAWNDTH
jgi:hypothetical protein